MTPDTPRGAGDGGRDARAAGDATPPQEDARKNDAGVDASGSYAAVQAELQAKRYPGPTTSQGSTGVCTESYLIWRDESGDLHSWSPASQATLDYTFTAPQTVVFFPSDTYIAVDSPEFNAVDVYDTTMPGNLIASIASSPSVAAGSLGVYRFDQMVNGVDLNATQVREWVAATGMIVDVGMQLPAQQPPSSFGLGEAVIPEGVNVPYPLYILNVNTAAESSVTFDGALTIYDTLPTSLGLVVSYARSGPTPEIRLYQNNDDTTRVEVGDEIASVPLLFPGGPPSEHNFIAHITADGENLIYESAFGIWSFGLSSGTLVPVQLGAGETVAIEDILCVIESTRTLVYRTQGDSVGQIWAVPLAGLLP